MHFVIYVALTVIVFLSSRFVLLVESCKWSGAPPRWILNSMMEPARSVAFIGTCQNTEPYMVRAIYGMQWLDQLQPIRIPVINRSHIAGSSTRVGPTPLSITSSSGTTLLHTGMLLSSIIKYY